MIRTNKREVISCKRKKQGGVFFSSFPFSFEVYLVFLGFEKIEFQCKSNKLAIRKLWNNIFSYLLYVVCRCVYLHLLFKYYLYYCYVNVIRSTEVKLISV